MSRHPSNPSKPPAPSHAGPEGTGTSSAAVAAPTSQDKPLSQSRRNRNHNRSQSRSPSSANPNNARRPHERMRRGVGIIIINDEGKVLAGLRYHSRGDSAGQAAWQLPQGGMEARERPLATAYRELHEETGLTPDDVELIAEMPRWTRYLLPKDWQNGKRFIGQVQRWFLFRYKKNDTPPISAALHKEFTELGWVEVNWLIGHVIAFRQPVYRQVFRHFAPYLAPHKILD